MNCGFLKGPAQRVSLTLFDRGGAWRDGCEPSGVEVARLAPLPRTPWYLNILSS
jgi:hypothetical protein